MLVTTAAYEVLIAVRADSAAGAQPRDRQPHVRPEYQRWHDGPLHNPPLQEEERHNSHLQTHLSYTRSRQL